MMYWLLSLGFDLVVFMPYMNKQKKIQISKYLIVVIGVILLYFLIATIARFADSDANTQGTLLLYAGQPYLNFCYSYETYSFQTPTFDRIFPLTNSILSGNFDLESYRDSIMSKSGLNIGVFYTLLGDLLIDIGVIGIFVYSFIYCTISKLFIKKKCFFISDLLILTLLFLIPLQGVFYYSFWKKQVTFCALLVVILSRYFKKFEN